MAEPLPTRDDAAEPAVADRGTAGLVEALELLRGRLAALRLPLEVPGVGTARHDLALAVDQLDDYLLPRLRSHSAPLLVVVGGSTGAGKSTLVNSVLGEHVSAPGVLRPTTRAPVLVHHPLDERWFSTDRVLPGLARVSAHRASGGARPVALDPARSLRLVASDALPQGLALVDAPDVDSVETANRELAAQLLGAADLWLFVTTAARYADAVPWDLLHGAAERRAQVAIVLDRVDPGAEAVADDLRRMMAENGLGAAPLFTVPERDLVEGFLPEDAVAELSAWLTALGADGHERDRVALATRDGVVDDLVRRAVVVAGAADAQGATDARLRDAVGRAYADAAARVDAATSDGVLLRGEVLSRWQDFVGTSDLFRSVEQGVGRVRDAVAAFFRGRPAQAPQVEQAIAHGLEGVVVDAAEDGAERAHATWQADPAGHALLGGLELARSSPGARSDVAAQIRAWQGDVLDLVREQGAGKRGAARALSFGVNGLGVSLMVVVFASTGGITGAEIGIAGGTALVAQKLLEAVFGDDAVRRLTRTARDRLAERVGDVLDAEARRYTAQLDALGTGGAGTAAQGVRDAARAVEAASRAERAARPVRRGRPSPGTRHARCAARPPRRGPPRRPGRRTTTVPVRGRRPASGDASSGGGARMSIDLADRTAALESAVLAGDGRLDAALLGSARGRAARAGAGRPLRGAHGRGARGGDGLRQVVGAQRPRRGRPRDGRRAASDHLARARRRLGGGRGRAGRAPARLARGAPSPRDEHPARVRGHRRRRAAGRAAQPAAGGGTTRRGAHRRPRPARPARPRLRRCGAPRARRAPRRARGPAGVGRGPAEVRGRGPARAVPAPARRARGRRRGRAQPGRPALPAGRRGVPRRPAAPRGAGRPRGRARARRLRAHGAGDGHAPGPARGRGGAPSGRERAPRRRRARRRSAVPQRAATRRAHGPRRVRRERVRDVQVRTHVPVHRLGPGEVRLPVARGQQRVEGPEGNRSAA
ncbi:hypothetical protein BJF88_16775, partial [Cellulosimicrobium sp. CUA-896]